jgi:pyrroline-5-carboxylate reductase
VQVPTPFWLIGCGNMAGAMLSRWLEIGLHPEGVTVIRPSGAAPQPGVRTVTEPPPGAPPALALLGIKPQKLGEVAPLYRERLGAETILISILAGVEQASLRERFPQVRAIVRAMPNTPVAVGKGTTALYASDVDRDAHAVAERLMVALGRAEWFDNEELFALAGHLAGAGPAFVYRFIEALADAAAELGLPEDQAMRLATSMVEGAGALAARSAEGPAELARRVASPGGTTEAGLNVLDSDAALASLMLRTLEASRRRGRELAAAAARRT